MVEVFPCYVSIGFARDVAEPWIDLLSGCEWGEVASALHTACHTDYGFSDEDCALFASRLLENIIICIENGDHLYFIEDNEEISSVQKKCKEKANFWLSGGYYASIAKDEEKKIVEQTLNSLPKWMFGGNLPGQEKENE